MTQKKGSWWFCPNPGEQKAMGWIVTIFFTIKILDIAIELIQSASKNSHWAFLGWFVFYTFGISVGVSATIRASNKNRDSASKITDSKI